MSDGAEVHNFLRIGFREHCKTGLTACVNVGMVAENVEGVGRYAACGNMEYAGKKFARDLIHIRDHQEKSLRRSVCSGESARRKRTVNGTRSTCLRLHFGYVYLCSEDVFETLSRPLVNVVRHRA